MYSYQAIIFAAVVSHSLVAVISFTASSSSTTFSPSKLAHCRHAVTTTRATSSLNLSTPNSGDWTNDDFLKSLGGNEQVSGYEEPQQQEQRKVPQNDLTDEEILEMSLRAAQFYNTDTSIEEAYGVRRKGPPRKKEE